MKFDYVEMEGIPQIRVESFNKEEIVAFLNFSAFMGATLTHSGEISLIPEGIISLPRGKYAGWIYYPYDKKELIKQWKELNK